MRDDLLSTIRDKQAIVAGLKEGIVEAKTPQDRNSLQMEMNRQKQMILNLKVQWLSLNPGKPFPFPVEGR